MNAKFPTILILLVSLAISSCATEKLIVPTSTSVPTFTPVPTQTPIPTATITPTSIALPTLCAKSNLTPEECANEGTHEYSTKAQISFDKTGQSCTIDDSNIVFRISFLSGETFQLNEASGPPLDFTRKDQNVYSLGLGGFSDRESTITFTAEGFIEESNTYDLEKNELLCTFVREQKIIGSAVTNPPIPLNNFKVYDSTDFIKENDLADRIPVFSVKYPPEWTYGWFGDSGVIVFLISAGDVNDAWMLKDTSGFTMMIIPNSYNGEELADLSGYDSADSIVQEPSAITINNQDALRVEYINNGSLQIVVVVVRGKWALTIFGQIRSDKEAEFRSVFEDMISTVEIK